MRPSPAPVAFASLALAALFLPSLASQSQALTFTNGNVDDHVDVAYAPGLLPRRGITVEAWITYDDSTLPPTGNRWPTVARQDVAPGGESWFLRVGAGSSSNRNLEWACHNGTNLQFTVYSFAPGEFLNWTHVAGTYDGVQATLYVNGQVAAQTNVSGALRDNQGVLRIGNGDVSAPGHEVWNGEIDEFRIWPFARTQAEIMATMGDTLFQAPGAITFNFDGNLTDSSSGFAGTPTTNVTFVPGEPNLAPAPLGGFANGSASTNCNQTVGSTLGARAVRGSAGFSYVLYDASANASGALFLATGLLTSPITVAGVSLYLDPNTLLPFGIGRTTDASGTARVALPLPQDPALAGFGLAGQWVLLDASCGSQGVVASDAVVAGFQ